MPEQDSTLVKASGALSFLCLTYMSLLCICVTAERHYTCTMCGEPAGPHVQGIAQFWLSDRTGCEFSGV